MRGTGGTSVAVVSTYAPTTCGIASYTASLVDALRCSSAQLEVDVVRLVDRAGGQPPPGGVRELVRGDGPSQSAAVRALNAHDVALVQHEYGIFGGPDGADVLELVRALRVPLVVTLHTVLSAPTASQWRILEELTRRAHRIVVMGETAARRLVEHHDVPTDRIALIPHGVRPPARPRDTPPTGRPLVATWGLLGPGKGIEWAVDAVARLGDLRRPPRYVVAGATHPVVREREGERYRRMLRARARSAGVAHRVTFDGRFLTPDELALLLDRAHAVVLPYEAEEQVTSGVLVEAIAAGRPVIATDFPHARELLDVGGAGLVVPRRDPEALAGALRAVLTRPALWQELAARARVLAADWDWPAVAERYRQALQAASLSQPSGGDLLASVRR